MEKSQDDRKTELGTSKGEQDFVLQDFLLRTDIIGTRTQTTVIIILLVLLASLNVLMVVGMTVFNDPIGDNDVTTFSF